MQVVDERCCGLDVHKRSVVACLIVPGPGGGVEKEVRTFGTMTDDLERLAAWLASRRWCRWPPPIWVGSAGRRRAAVYRPRRPARWWR